MNGSETPAAIVATVNILYKIIMITLKRLGPIMSNKAQSNPTKAPRKQRVNKAIPFKLKILVNTAGERRIMLGMVSLKRQLEKLSAPQGSSKR